MDQKELDARFARMKKSLQQHYPAADIEAFLQKNAWVWPLWNDAASHVDPTNAPDTVHAEHNAIEPVPADQVTIAQAKEALDDMDDYARMGVGLNPIGARGVLERFIEQCNPHSHLEDCVQCGGPMSKNPHPDAGVPARLMEIGAVYVCIPCIHESARYWIEHWRDRARKAEEMLQEASCIMDTESALELAKKVGGYHVGGGYVHFHKDQLERFAALIQIAQKHTLLEWSQILDDDSRGPDERVRIITARLNHLLSASADLMKPTPNTASREACIAWAEVYFRNDEDFHTQHDLEIAVAAWTAALFSQGVETNRTLDDACSKLLMAIPGSCTCASVALDHDQHDRKCRYKLIAESIALLTMPKKST